MTFVLTMVLCSHLEATCMRPVSDKTIHNTFKNCMMVGYEAAKILLNTINDEDVNNKQIYVNFSCREIKTI